MNFMNPEKARTISQPIMFGTTPFWNDGRIKTFIEMIQPFNMVSNPRANYDTSGWTPNNANAQISRVINGDPLDNGPRFKATTQAGAFLYTASSIKVTPGDTWTLSVYVAQIDGSVESAQVRIRAVYNPGTGSTFTDNPDTTVSNQWNRIVYTVKIPENVEKLQFNLRINTPNSGVVAFSRAQMVKLSNPIDPLTDQNTGVPRLQVELNRVLSASSQYTILGPMKPFHIPNTYGDPTGQEEALNIVNSDIFTAGDLATRYRIFGDNQAAAKAAQIISSWSTINSWEYDTGATTKLVWSNKLPILIQAAMLISDSSAYTTTINNNFKAMLQLSINNNVSSAYDYTNNVGVWGTVFLISSGIFLNNRNLFNDGIELWRRNFDHGIVNNIPIYEIYREANGQGNGSTGLWYCNFLVYAHTIAAEWARFAGEWLYDYKGKDGSTFRGVAELVRYWTRNPELYPYNTSGKPSQTVRSLPHDEILHALWPNADSQWIINNYPNGSDRDSTGLRGSVLIYRGRPLYG